MRGRSGGHVHGCVGRDSVARGEIGEDDVARRDLGSQRIDQSRREPVAVGALLLEVGEARSGDRRHQCERDCRGPDRPAVAHLATQDDPGDQAHGRAREGDPDRPGGPADDEDVRKLTWVGEL